MEIIKQKLFLHLLLDQQAETHFDKIAIESKEGNCTYGQLKEASNAIGNELLSSSIEKSDVVGVFMNSSIPAICAMVGIFKSNAIYLPLDTSYPDKRLIYMCEKSGLKTIITDTVNKERLRTLLKDQPEILKEKTFVVIDWEDRQLLLKNASIDADDKQCEEMNWLPNIEPLPTAGFLPDDSNYLLFTSGSTGNPKAILGRHKSLSHFIHWEKKAFSIISDCRTSQLAPLSFDVSLRDIWLPLLSGGTLCIPTDNLLYKPALLLDWIASKDIQVVHMVPTIFRLLTKELEKLGDQMPALQRLKYIFLAGEALYVKDVQMWNAVAPDHIQLVNLYGPSETTLAKIFHPIKELNEDPTSIVPLGKAISNTLIIILKGDNTICKIGEIGEICIKTPFRSKGYYNDPELTAQNFIQNPLHNDFEDIIYKTGDLGKYLEDRSIAFIGRKDNQVKIRGNRIELSEIESCLLRKDEIDQVLVQPIVASNNNLLLCCYYIKSSPIEEKEILDYLQQYLPNYMWPSFFIALESFPISVNGKVDRRALPNPEELLYLDQDYVAPSSPLEEQIATIWSEVLGIKKVGVQHSFFRLGGHSLTAIKVVSEIYRVCGFELSLKEFFEYRTIDELAKHLEGKAGGTFQSIPKVAVQNHYAVSYSQRRFWLLEQRFPELTAYNMTEAHIVESALDIPALIRSFKTIIDRHETLRTIFKEVDSEPRQFITKGEPYHIEQIDQSHVMADNVTALIHQIVEAELDIPFDLQKGPLYRFKITRLPKGKILISFTFHHIIYDGWSSGVFMTELLQLYMAYVQNKANPLEPVTIQYKDFAAWQNQIMAKTGDHAARTYWHQKLGGEIPDLQLPYDTIPSDEKSFDGATLPVKFETTLSAQIRAYCKEKELSLYFYFIALIKLILYKYSGQTDICVGSPIVDRSHPDLINQIGLYLNNVVLRNQLEVEKGFESFVQTVKQTALEAYQNKEYPYDKLVEELSPETGHSNGFYKVLVVMNNQELDGRAEDVDTLEQVLKLESIYIPENTSKLDLTFFIHDDDPIQIEIEYRSAHFESTTIQTLADQLPSLAKLLFEEPDMSLINLVGQLSAKEEQQLRKNNIEAINENF